MGLRSLRRKVEDLERARRPMRRPIVAVLPDGTKYLLVGPRLAIAPRRRKRGDPPPEPGAPPWYATEPGSWRRVRPSDGPLDGAKFYHVNTLLCFASITSLGGGGPVRATIDPDKVRESRRLTPICRSRD